MIIEPLTEAECYLYALTQDESGLDLAEFCYVDETQEDGCWRAWPFQFAWFRINQKKTIEAAARSVGKALDITTPILTSVGWKTLETVSVGDYVYDENGQKTKVTHVFDIMNGRPCYELTFDDNSTLVADEEHQWYTHTTKAKSFSVRTTKQIFDTQRDSSGANHSVSVARPIERDEVDLPINPYVFGMWLGDGNSNDNGITIGDQDFENTNSLFEQRGYKLRSMKGKIKYCIDDPKQGWRYLEPINLEKRRANSLTNEEVRKLRSLAHDGMSLDDLARQFKKSKSTVSDIVTASYRVDAGGWIRPNHHSIVKQHLENLGVIKNKHIPKIYMTSSIGQRIELLRGIMDSDGHCTLQSGRCEITLKSKLLIDDVFELLLSLGQKPYIRSRQATCNFKAAGTVYVVTFSPMRFNPFNLDRKKDRVVFKDHKTRVTERRIRSVEKVDSRPVRCISVDSPNHLFLVGKKLIPTHNSMGIRLRALAFPFVKPGDEMVVTAPEAIHLQAVTDNIEIMYTNNRLAKEMLQGQIKHRPFHINFTNGARLMGRIPHRDGSGIKGCFEKGTLVLTRRGCVPIEEVVVGDEVFTHLGNWKPVTHTWVFQEENPVHVKANRLSEGVTCSGIEPFWARYGNIANMKRIKPEWRFAKDIGQAHSKTRRWNLHSPAEFPSEPQPVFPVHLNNDLETLYWIFGLYQAEGSVSVKANQAVFSVHVDEIETVQAALARLGYKASVSKDVGKQGRNVYVSSKAFVDLLRQNFGQAKGKTIPVWMYGAPTHLKQAFFDGALYGDGYKKHDHSYEYVTVLRSLAYEMKMLAQSLGYTASVHRNNTKTSLSSNGWYRVLILDLGRTNNFIDSYIMAGVQEVTDLPPMTVYDLTVADDHSFTANSVFARNTHPIWLQMDEAQDYGAPGWKEITPTVKKEPDSRWACHGVTRGLGDDFDDKIEGKDSTWHVKKIPAMYRPSWTEQERQDSIQEYRGYDSSGYRRNILGISSNEDSPLFVLHRIMSCHPSGTLVSVRDIESPDHMKLVDISDVKEGDMVYNASTAGVGVVLATTMSNHSELTKLTIEGEDVYVTPDHHYFTRRGWIEAGNLRRDDLIFNREGVRALREGHLGQGEEDLFKELLVLLEKGSGQIM